MSESDFQYRLQSIYDRIGRACNRSRREPDQVSIIAVTKTFALDTVRKACTHSLYEIGENRVQEALDKYKDGEFLKEFPSVHLHLIGHLQSNKVRKALQIFSSIDSIDSIRLAESVDRIAAEVSIIPRILLEVNTSGEPQKFGFDPGSVVEAATEIASYENTLLAGLMSVGPNVDDSDSIRTSFRQLRDLFETAGGRINSPNWTVLSMGMSHDFEIAVEEGATEIRLGSILFGSRR